MKSLKNAVLYGIVDTGYVALNRLAEVTAQMLEGGVDVLQLRAKELESARLIDTAGAVGAVCRSAATPFIVNDYPELVEACGAQGAHVGQDDVDVSAARNQMPAESLVGKSTHSVEQARAAAAESPDYIGYGPLFATPTKPDYEPVGLDDIRLVVEEAPSPVFCIGGIKLDNLADVVAAGANRVVIVSGILQAPDIPAYCRQAKQLLLDHAC